MFSLGEGNRPQGKHFSHSTWSCIEGLIMFLVDKDSKPIRQNSYSYFFIWGDSQCHSMFLKYFVLLTISDCHQNNFLSAFLISKLDILFFSFCLANDERVFPSHCSLSLFFPFCSFDTLDPTTHLLSKQVSYIFTNVIATGIRKAKEIYIYKRRKFQEKKRKQTNK